MHFVWSNLGFLLPGIALTVQLTLLGFAGALVLGTIGAVSRVSPVMPLRVAGALYVECFRNTPLVTLLVLFVFGLPAAGLSLSLTVASEVCLAMAGGAFVCEAIRSGINTVPVGQAEAARALGLTMAGSLQAVILPQAFRAVIQPLANILIGIFLGSSLASAVGVSELTNRTEQLNLQYAQAVTCFLFSGTVYLAGSLVIGAVSGQLEKRLGSTP